VIRLRVREVEHDFIPCIGNDCHESVEFGDSVSGYQSTDEPGQETSTSVFEIEDILSHNTRDSFVI
jgi:hypothetical protein